MWRSMRIPIPKTYKHSTTKRIQPYSSSSTSSSGGSVSKLVFGVVAATGVGFTGAVVYGKYDSKVKELLKENVPYIDNIYKLLGDDKKQTGPSKSAPEEKTKDSTIPGSLLRKKMDREKSSTPTEAQKSSVSTESRASASDSKTLDSNNLKTPEAQPIQQEPSSPSNLESEPASNESQISKLIENLQNSSKEAKVAYSGAVKAVKHHTASLYDALELDESKDDDIVWKEVKKAGQDRNNALKTAQDKARQTKKVIGNLEDNLKKVVSEKGANDPLVKKAEQSVSDATEQLKQMEAEVHLVETEAETATEYQKLVNESKEQFQKELNIVLPNYLYGDKDKSESDLNMLIAHAHRRIEQLQKQLAKQQVTEKLRIEAAVHQQMMKDDKLANNKIESELEKRHEDLEKLVSERVAGLKENFENELRKQLLRQSAAHADHLEEALKMQELELDRQFSLELEEKLLHQKGVFISEVSGNMARLKGILAFLKAKGEFDKSSKKAQALWLACQSMNDKISFDNGGEPCPLGKEVAALKLAADEDSEFVNSVLASIPTQAVNRGVYNSEIIRSRFQDVQKVCRKVALIDENNDSLYRYFLSYLQSLLMVEAVSIPKEELSGKVAVDPSEWDTFDVLGRIAYSLKINDLEQALRYANQLKGEPKVVAKDWINEVRLLLETQLAVKALLAHAAAVGVQAYH